MKDVKEYITVYLKQVLLNENKVIQSNINVKNKSAQPVE